MILGAGQRSLRPLQGETGAARTRYGRHTFGQDCLVARRMVEQGVPYVVINYPGGWDTHSNHFATMRRQCPQLDQGLAALLADLEGPRAAGTHPGLVLRRVRPVSQGRLAAALEWRPQPSWQRLHRAGGRRRIQRWSCGRRIGREGEEVKDRPVYPVDLLGSIYHLAGIDPRARLPHPMGVEAHVLPSARKA